MIEPIISTTNVTVSFTINVPGVFNKATQVDTLLNAIKTEARKIILERLDDLKTPDTGIAVEVNKITLVENKP
jgi:hypothetical protein